MARCFLAPLVLLALAVCVHAKDEPAPPPTDEIQLADGSRIVGTVISQGGGNLVVRTTFAGDLKIKAEAVKGITANRPLVFTPDKGEPVTGVPVYDADRGQVITQTAAGDMVVGRPMWKTIVDPAAPVVPAPSAASGGSNPPALPHDAPKPVSPWSGRLEIGLAGATGNTERFNTRVRGELNRVEPTDRLKLYIEGNYATENSVRSRNEFIGGARYEKDIDEHWFAFGKGELEHDEFESLAWRATATGGVGYFFIREKTQELKGRAGLGYQHEKFFDGHTTDRPIAELGYDYRIDINQWVRLTNGFTYYPSLTDPTESYRAVMETAGEVPLEKDGAWRIRAGMRNEYNADAQPGIERLDTTYFLNLVYEMK